MKWWLLGKRVALSALFMHAIAIPLGYMMSKKFRCSLHNLHFINSPCLDYKNPEKYNVHGARNFYISHESEVDKCTINLGVWQTLSKSAYLRNKEKINNVSEEEKKRIFEEELFNSDVPIVLYLHGITKSRAFLHRVELYNILQELDMHVIAFDYRGYGDSTKVIPSKPGNVEDSLVVYSWLRRLVGNEKSVIVWGHSLGSAIALNAMTHLPRCTTSPGLELALPRALVLEGSFNNIFEAMEEFPFSKYFNWLPYFYTGMIGAIYKNTDVKFIPEEDIKLLTTTPILMLHARDDNIVWYNLGTKLYGQIVKSRKNDEERPVFKALMKGGHVYICRDHKFPEIVRDFVQKYK